MTEKQRLWLSGLKNIQKYILFPVTVPVPMPSEFEKENHKRSSRAAGAVADRFHLLFNLRDALKRVFQRHSYILKETFKLFDEQNNTENQQDEKKVKESSIIPASENNSLFTGNVSSQRQFKFEKAKDLYVKGYSIGAIAKHLKTVYQSVSGRIQKQLGVINW